MLTARDIKRQSRRDLHNSMAIPAFYFRTPASDPVLVHVRVWPAFKGKIGEVKGSRTYPALMENETDQIRFDLTEIPRIEQNAIVSVEAGEAYCVDHTIPPDDEFQTAEVSRVPAVQAAGLAVPPSDA